MEHFELVKVIVKLCYFERVALLTNYIELKVFKKFNHDTLCLSVSQSVQCDAIRWEQFFRRCRRGQLKHEENILGQIYEKQIFSDFIMMNLILFNIIRKCMLIQQYSTKTQIYEFFGVV